MAGRNDCSVCYQKKKNDFTSCIRRRVLTLCSVATPVPRWCEHMGERERRHFLRGHRRGRTSAATMQSRGRDYIKIPTHFSLQRKFLTLLLGDVTVSYRDTTKTVMAVNSGGWTRNCLERRVRTARSGSRSRKARFGYISKVPRPRAKRFVVRAAITE